MKLYSIQCRKYLKTFGQMEVSAYMYMPEVEYSENIGICRPGGPYWETLYPNYGQRPQAEIRF